MAHARHVEMFLCDAVFRVEHSFYIGAANGVTPLDWEAASIRPTPPAMPRELENQVTTAELRVREDEPAEYHRRLITVARTHGKAASLRHPPAYFRTQPTIISNGAALTSFSWNDNLRATASVLEVSAGSARGAADLILDDQDQGWRILIATAGTLTCFVDWDAEAVRRASGTHETAGPLSGLVARVRDRQYETTAATTAAHRMPGTRR